MTLLLTMLPFYLVGNLHCAGMCGPLVFMLSKHRYRYWYFLGRFLAFTLAAGIAGAFGSIISIFLHQYHLSAVFTLVFGVGLIYYSLQKSMGRQIKFPLPTFFHTFNRKIASILLYDTRWHTFLFGFSAVLLPCGQSMFVFSACALAGGLVTGALNGAAFALLTSPSLFFVMHTHRFLKGFQAYYEYIIILAAIFVGTLAVCRGLAEWEIIDHWVISSTYHIVLF